MTLADQKRDKDLENNIRGLKKMRYRSYDEMKKSSPYADPDAGPEPITLKIALHELSTNVRSQREYIISFINYKQSRIGLQRCCL